MNRQNKFNKRKNLKCKSYSAFLSMIGNVESYSNRFEVQKKHKEQSISVPQYGGETYADNERELLTTGETYEYYMYQRAILGKTKEEVNELFGVLPLVKESSVSDTYKTMKIFSAMRSGTLHEVEESLREKCKQLMNFRHDTLQECKKQQQEQIKELTARKNRVISSLDNFDTFKEVLLSDLDKIEPEEGESKEAFEERVSLLKAQVEGITEERFLTTIASSKEAMAKEYDTLILNLKNRHQKDLSQISKVIDFNVYNLGVDYSQFENQLAQSTAKIVAKAGTAAALIAAGQFYALPEIAAAYGLTKGTASYMALSSALSAGATTITEAGFESTDIKHLAKTFGTSFLTSFAVQGATEFLSGSLAHSSGDIVSVNGTSQVLTEKTAAALNEVNKQVVTAVFKGIKTGATAKDKHVLKGILSMMVSAATMGTATDAMAEAASSTEVAVDSIENLIDVTASGFVEGVMELGVNALVAGGYDQGDILTELACLAVSTGVSAFGEIGFKALRKEVLSYKISSALQEDIPDALKQQRIAELFTRYQNDDFIQSNLLSIMGRGFDKAGARNNTTFLRGSLEQMRESYEYKGGINKLLDDLDSAEKDARKRPLYAAGDMEEKPLDEVLDDALEEEEDSTEKELTETEKFCKEAFKLRIGNLSEFQEESNVEVADNPEEYLLPKFEASKVIAGVEEKVGYKLSTTEEFNIPGA